MHLWSAGLQNSHFGYLRIISADGKEILAGTGEITGGRQLKEVLGVLKEASEQLDWGRYLEKTARLLGRKCNRSALEFQAGTIQNRAISFKRVEDPALRLRKRRCVCVAFSSLKLHGPWP